MHNKTCLGQHWRYFYSINPKLYHNLDHILSFDLSQFQTEEGKIAALMHDANYSPWSTTNEEAACEAVDEVIQFLQLGQKEIPFDIDRVKQLIMSTKDHIGSYDTNDNEMTTLHYHDLRCFVDDSMDIHSVAKRIFYEYGFVKFSEFKKKRIEILEKFMKHPLVSYRRIGQIVAHLKSFKPRIGVYCGSFNPIHRGHWDVLRQAQRIFDKVIVAQGQNPEKATNTYDIRDVKTLSKDPSIQLETYTGSIFEFLETQKEDVELTLIRGLRNSNDLTYEQNIQKVIKEFSGVPSINIISSPELSHISSSLIRELDKLGTPHQYSIN